MNRIIHDFLATGNTVNHLGSGPNNRRKANFVWTKSFVGKYNPPKYQGGRGKKQTGGRSEIYFRKFTPPTTFRPAVMPPNYI